MTIRDLGYRPYDGPRLPPGHTWQVLLRHGMRRAWGSWLVKLAAFTGWIPPVVALAILGINFWVQHQLAEQGLPPDTAGPLIQPAQFVRVGFMWQTWLFVSLVSTGAGASAIAEDLTHKAFQFYFAKPVTPPQYLVARVAAVAIWSFGLLFVPAVLEIVVLVATALDGTQLERAGLILPALLYSLMASLAFATVSVGISSLAKSRAMTITAWLVLFIVPHVLGMIVMAIAEWPWLLLASLPGLLGVLGDALFKIEATGDLRWYHAAPVLAGIFAGALFLADRRLRRAEVIT
jgi:hypothetical protein